MAKVQIVVFGIGRLDRQLRNLKIKSKKLYTDAAKKALKPVREEARALAPKRTGLLSRKMKIRVLPRSRRYIGARVTIGEGDFKGKTFYGSFQEWGWRTGKRRSRSTLPRRKIPGQFFLWRATNAKREEAKKLLIEEIRNGIDKYLAMPVAGRKPFA